MRSQSITCLAASLALIVVLAGSVNTKAGGPSKKSNDALVDALRKTGSVTKAHRALKPLKGEYEQAVKWWSAPGAKPEEDRCTSKTGWLFGGTFLTQKVKGKWLGLEYDGLATIGHDNGTGEYVLTWIDSFHSGVFTARGSYDKASNGFTFQGSYFDAVAEQDCKIKVVLTFVDKRGAAHIEIFDMSASSEPVKFMEIDSKRFVRRGA